ncbi:YbjQ family protein [Hellea balneolensis]|uniref:YbjQ family protein n=1 Tax=Hellea balneolensis TaxID=287478 RepID=UPI00041BF6D8|nr:heavy metal-binding domain-containing protein [Hellea balneolensis]
MGGLITFFVLLLIGLIFGSMNERNHFKRLRIAEEELSHIKVFNIKTLPDNLETGGALVSGNVVVAVDYFKVIAAFFKMVFGGQLRSFESLMERGRREAVVRMQREAEALGADAIYNARLEFSAIGQQPQKIGGAELLAYGTAVKIKS